ncbi:hypothetical protein G6F57_023067 [Rhizopus arrhizus]|nr:hypothetical protein G6F57_023067 [Rhizopus arrhizus]
MLGVQIGFHVPVADVVGGCANQSRRAYNVYARFSAPGLYLALDVAHRHGAGLAVRFQAGQLLAFIRKGKRHAHVPGGGNGQIEPHPVAALPLLHRLAVVVQPHVSPAIRLDDQSGLLACVFAQRPSGG